MVSLFFPLGPAPISQSVLVFTSPPKACVDHEARFDPGLSHFVFTSTAPPKVAEFVLSSPPDQ